MSTLHIIDNPAGLSRQDDVAWPHDLAARWQEGDRLLLVGFTADDVIEIRRDMSPALSEPDILAVLGAAEQALGAADPELCALALQGLMATIAHKARRYVTHAGQPSRAASFEPQACPAAASGSATKPRLAFISPLPPEATGIAEYSAELLPYLAEHYDITLVTPQSSLEATLRTAYPVLEPEAFEARADDFDRVLYQIGNSPFHAFQFDLLRRRPGTVVLHDVYLFDAVWWLKDSGTWPDGLRRQLFLDHGYPAVLAHDEASEGASQRGPEEYPVNGFVTREASGIIYHSEHAREIDRHWRADALREEDVIIPHLRRLPDAVTPEARRSARQALGVDEDTCLIASFGGINPKKLTDRLVEAVLEHDWSAATRVQLVLVGAQHAGDFGQRLADRLKRHPQGARVTITGYVSRESYQQWLRAADIAVQLRQESRGESSGAVLDAMAHGLAVIANAHGSNAELPPGGVAMLPETVTISGLTECLERLVGDVEGRAALAERARQWIAAQLDPAAVAARYREAIDGFAVTARRQRRDAWLDRLATRACLREAEPETFQRLTRRLVEVGDLSPVESPRLLFDVSTIAWHDLKTGIERVTRRLADHLLRHPPAGWRVELVRWGGDDFHLARGFASDQLGIRPPGPDRPCQARPGDVYVSVEWAPPLLEQAGEALRDMRARGVRCYFTVHDLLPLRLPDCFPPGTQATMRRWFEGIAALADGITCVSATVAEDVRKELADLPRDHRPWVAPFHLGADFAAGGKTTTLTGDERQLLATLEGLEGPTLLMVGTMEPRKGHRQVLEALEWLWQKDEAINLVIVGKQGWEVDDLADRLSRHALRGQRLFWVEGASDALLEALYADADALMAASLGEGFGLPLIEAAQHGIPILARDIPVFREVAGTHADYFRADTADTLAEALEEWRQRWSRGELADSSRLPFNSWARSAEQWLGHILADLPAPAAPGQPQETPT